MHDRIVHPTDGSEHADAAADHAVDLALAHDAAFHALYVADVTAGQRSDVFSMEASRMLEANGREHVEAVTDRAAEAGVREVTSEVVTGTPAKAIVEEAADGDLVVLGTRGRSGLDRVLIGSTAERVVRTSDVPVLTVPDGDEAGA